MAFVATASLAWGTGLNWDTHPLTANRIDKHQRERVTRQVTQRSLPKQSSSTSDSLISRLVEIWEMFPEEIKTETQAVKAKHKIRQWVGTRHLVA